MFRQGLQAGRLAVVLAALALAAGAPRGDEPSPPAAAGDAPPVLETEEAQRLFLGFIYDRRSLVRNCLFLGGVNFEDISYRGFVAVARIRYRIQCEPEEIDAPSLTRVLVEEFIYQYSDNHWELLGRASELPPSRREGGPAGTGSAPPRPPVAADEPRRAVAEIVLTWIAEGIPPLGTRDRFPGGRFFPPGRPVLVSEENLPGVPGLSSSGRDALLLSPAALVQRTAVLGEGTWIRFDEIEMEDEIARVVVSVMAPVIPTPRPGDPLTRVLSRVEADFVHRRAGWTLTRHRLR